MLKIGDTVRVIGEAVGGNGGKKEYIPICTICRVIGIENDKKEGLLVEIIPENQYPYSDWGYWYRTCDVEKGHMEWIRDES